MKIRSAQSTVQDLRQLVVALDRRVLQIGRDREPAIAHDAQGLKRAALKQIDKLERLRCAQRPCTAAQETV